MIEELRKMCEMVENLPPQPRAIRARWDVPISAGVKRMWDTRGELTLYVNRGVIERLPKQEVKYGPLEMTIRVLGANLTGIPVYFEGPEREVWEMQQSLHRWIWEQT